MIHIWLESSSITLSQTLAVDLPGTHELSVKYNICGLIHRHQLSIAATRCRNLLSRINRNDIFELQRSMNMSNAVVLAFGL